MRRKITYNNDHYLSVTKENFSSVIFNRNDVNQRMLNLMREAIDYLINRRKRLLRIQEKELLSLKDRFPHIMIDGERYYFYCENEGCLGVTKSLS